MLASSHSNRPIEPCTHDLCACGADSRIAMDNDDDEMTRVLMMINDADDDDGENDDGSVILRVLYRR